MILKKIKEACRENNIKISFSYDPHHDSLRMNVTDYTAKRYRSNFIDGDDLESNIDHEDILDILIKDTIWERNHASDEEVPVQYV